MSDGDGRISRVDVVYVGARSDLVYHSSPEVPRDLVVRAILEPEQLDLRHGDAPLAACSGPSSAPGRNEGVEVDVRGSHASLPE